MHVDTYVHPKGILRQNVPHVLYYCKVSSKSVWVILHEKQEAFINAPSQFFACNM